MKGTLIVVLVFAIGCLAGYSGLINLESFGEIGANLTMYVLYLLIFLVGISMGCNPELKKIIKSVGMDMVRLEKYQGTSADIAASLCLLLSSVFGIPVSTTHTKTSAIMGVGASRRLSAINFSVVKDMVLTWIFTFPGCGLISFLIAKLFMFLF